MGKVPNHVLGTKLVEAGLMPPECRLVNLEIGGATGAVTVTFESFLTIEQLGKLGDVFAAIAREEGEPSGADKA